MKREYILKKDYDFWTKGGRKTQYKAGTKFMVEIETLSSQDGGKCEHYYIYTKENGFVALYEVDEFFDLFFTEAEERDLKLDKLI